MNFIIGLPKVTNKETIWVVVDRLTKYVHFIVIPTKIIAAWLAEFFVVEIYWLHEIPKVIISYRDSLFLRIFWKDIFKLSGTKLSNCSNYDPKMNGQTYVTNKKNLSAIYVSLFPFFLFLFSWSLTLVGVMGRSKCSTIEQRKKKLSNPRDIE